MVEAPEFDAPRGGTVECRVPIRRRTSQWLPPVAMAAVLFGTAIFTTPSRYALAHGGILACLYLLLAAALHGATQLAARIHRHAGFASACAVVLIVAWHVREHFRPAGTVPSLEDLQALGTFLVAVSIPAIFYGLITARTAVQISGNCDVWRTALTGIAFFGLLAGCYHSSNTLRWHLHQHNRLLGPLVSHLFAEDVATVKVRLWEQRTSHRDSASAPGSASATLAPTVPAQRHIVFVMIDALRWDAVFHRSAPADTPRLERIAREAFVFTDVRANSSWTQPSVASFFTGLLPEEHGAIHGSALNESNLTLAEILKSLGYTTVAFVTNTVVRAEQGFDQGFDEYFEIDGIDRPYAPAEEVTQAVQDWLSRYVTKGPDRPVFAYVHYVDAHTPYLQGSALNPASHTDAKAEYVAELEYLDLHLDTLLDSVSRDLGDNIVVLITSDHGEEFGEHGERGHGHTLYGEVTKIPAMLWSGRANDRGVISAKLEGRDFFRLLLQFLQPSHPNVGKWASRNERSLRYASVYNAHHNSPLYQLLRPRLANVAMRSIEHKQWRLVWSGLGDTYELYDLENDPGELDNLADRRPVIVERLARMMESAVTDWDEGSPERRSEKALERLRSLGYVR